MKSIKKLLALAIIATLVLGLMPVAFAAAPSDVAGTKYEKAVNILTTLGIVQGYPDGTYKPQNIVTRAEMAKLIVIAMGYNDAADISKGVTMFKDVAANHWASGYINVAASLGIIKGFPDGTFKPNDTVTYPQAVTMLVRALGYTDEDLAGTWPTNYLVKAATVGVTKDVTVTTGGAIRGDIAVLVYNTLNKATVIRDTNGKAVANGEPLINKLGELKTITVLATPNVDSSLDEGKVQVTGGIMDTETTLDEYLGKQIEVVVVDDVIVAVNKVKSTDVKTFTITKDENFVTGSVYEFKDVKVKVDDIPAVVNGVKTTLSAAAGLIGKNAEVVLINNDDDTAYDYAIINKAAKGVVPYIVKNNVSSTAKYIDNKIKLYDADDNAYKVFGDATKATEIKAGDVVYEISVGGTKVLYVVRKTVEGTIAQVITGADTKVVINGTEYVVSNSVTGDTIAVKDSGKATLDKDNKIIKWVKSSTTVEEKYAYVVSKGTWDEWNAKIKLLTGTDTVVYDVVYDNVGDEIPAGVSAGQIVKYTLNSAGKIDSIDIITTLTGFNPKPIEVYTAAKAVKVVDDVYYVTDDTLLMNVKYDGTAVDSFEIVKLSDIKDKSYNVIYNVDNIDLTYLIFKDAEFVTEEEEKPLVYVTDSVTIKTADKEFTRLTVLENGVEKTYDTKTKLTVGKAVYELTFDNTGLVTNVSPASPITISSGTAFSIDYSKMKITYGSSTKYYTENVVVIDATGTDEEVTTLANIPVNTSGNLTEDVDMYTDKYGKVVLIIVK